MSRGDNRIIVQMERIFKCIYSSLDDITIGGSKGGAAGVPPLTGSNSFIFAFVFTKKCLRRRSAPPPMARHPQREILDPPLITYIIICISTRFTQTSASQHIIDGLSCDELATSKL